MTLLTLYHTSSCPSCLAQKKILQQLQQQYPEIRVHYINLEQAPDSDLVPAIQSVPTLTINHYRFEGILSARDIDQWLGADNHDKAYLSDLLKNGQLLFAQQWLQQHPAALPRVIDLLIDDSIDMTVRIGLDALIEYLADNDKLSPLTHELGKILWTVPESICIDMLHYLAMIGTEEAADYIKTGTTQSHPEVQRIASELLAEMDV